MDFTFTDEQHALRELTREFLAKHGDSASVRAAIARPDGFDRAAWHRITGELGLAGLAVPEHLGGAGAGLLEVMIVVEELGSCLLPVPYLSSAVAAALLGELADADPWAARSASALAEGSLIGAFACGETAAGAAPVVRVDSGGRLHGVADHVIDAAVADVLLVVARAETGPVLCGVRTGGPGVSVTALATLDATRPQARVAFTGAPAHVLGEAAGQRAVQLMWTALAMEAAGAARRCLASTVGHLLQRTQFGRVLGSFQALKHRCADLAVEIESAASTAYYATWAATDAPEEIAVVAPLAKAHCADVLFHAAAEAVQLHGGIGVTWEHDAHLFLKRAKTTQLLYGSPSYLRALVGQRAGVLG